MAAAKSSHSNRQEKKTKEIQTKGRVHEENIIKHYAGFAFLYTVAGRIVGMEGPKKRVCYVFGRNISSVTSVRFSITNGIRQSLQGIRHPCF